MNLAITTTSARTWKAVKTHYLVAIAGAALAITSLAGAASLSIDWGGSGGAISRPVPPAAASADQRYLTFYLVGSEAERDRVIAGEDEAARERLFSGVPERNQRSFAVFVARTPDEVGSALLSIYDATSDGSEAVVNVIDLTGR